MPHQIRQNDPTKATQGTPLSGVYSGLKGQNTNQCQNTYFLMYLSYSSFNFDIINLNTAGIGGPNNASKRQKIFNSVKKHPSPNGIMFLQETHSTEKVEAIWTNQWGCGKGAITLSHGMSDSRGVLIAFREGLDYKINSVFCDNEHHLFCKIRSRVGNF